jgi:hypothetical protein
MADPTASEVRAALAVLAAAEVALESAHPVAAPIEPVKSSESPAVSAELEAALFAAVHKDVAVIDVAPAPSVSSPPAAVIVPEVVPVDVATACPWLARSVKSSPNGF